MKYKLRQLLKMFTQHIVFPFLYFINRWKRVDEKLVVLADAHHESCPPHMQEIKKKLIEENYQVREFYRDVKKLGTLKGFISLAGFMRIYTKCKTVIICDNFLPVSSCRKKKETKVIQLWHGCGAFKRFGYDAKDDIPKGYKGNVYKNYDLVTVSGNACVPHFESAMGLKDIVKPMGLCHTDRLFDEEYISKCKLMFEKQYPDAKGKKVVLWAPTFRGNAHDGRLEGEDVIDSIAAMDEFGDYYFIKSLHPHIEDAKSVREKNMNTDQLIVCTDVLITDYSSVFFEAGLINKPVIFFASDYQEYLDNRGFYLEYNQLPGKIAKNKQELIRALGEGALEIYNNDFYGKYMNGCDGRVCDRVIDFISGRNS